MFLLVGPFVRLSLTNGKADWDDSYVKRTVLALEWTSRGLFPDPATSRCKEGQKVPPPLPPNEKFKYFRF